MNYWSKGNPRKTSMEDGFLEQDSFQLNNFCPDNFDSRRFSRLSFDLAENMNSNCQQNIDYIKSGYLKQSVESQYQVTSSFSFEIPSLNSHDQAALPFNYKALNCEKNLIFPNCNFYEKSELLITSTYPIKNHYNCQFYKEDIPIVEHNNSKDIPFKKNEKYNDSEEILQASQLSNLSNEASLEEKPSKKVSKKDDTKKAKRGRKRKHPDKVKDIAPFRFITEIDEYFNYQSKEEESNLKLSENFSKKVLKEDLFDIQSIFKEEPSVLKHKENLKIASSELRKEASDKRIRIKGRFVTRSQAFVYLGVTPYEIASNKVMQDIFSKYSGYSILTKAQNEVKIRNLQTLLQRSFKGNKLPEIDPLNKIEIRILNENKNLKQIEISIHKSVNLFFPNTENQLLDSKESIQSKNQYFPIKIQKDKIETSILKISRPKIIDAPLEHLHHHRKILTN